MNFNHFHQFNHFGDSLKHSYQSYWRQDAEARESNRRFLLKLQKFEFKAAELASRTQVAQHMKNQYEKMLMHQNPLLWAQIQRTLAGDLAELEHRVPLSGSTLNVREVGVNTMGLDSSSASDDGVWPNSPSPHPEVTTKMPADVLNFTGEASNVTIGRETNNYLNLPVTQFSKNGIQDRRSDNRDIKTSPTPKKAPEIHISGSENDKFVPGPPVDFMKPIISEGFSHDIHENHTTEPKKGQIVQSTLHNLKNLTLDSNVSHPKPPVIDLTVVNKQQIIEEKHAGSQEKAIEKIQEEPDKCANSDQETKQDEATFALKDKEVPQPPVPETFKPFRLDSDSESAPVSGPTGPPAEEDSDSFWN